MQKQLNMIRRSILGALIGASLVAASTASADAMQRGQLPRVEGITIIGVADGQLQYRAGASTVTAQLSEINTLEIDNVPQFAVGQAAFNEGSMRNAQRAFEEVWSGSREQWARHYAGFYLVQIHDQRNEPVEAATIFATLAQENADLFFLSRPPTASIAQADQDQKQRIREQLQAVIRDADPARRAVLQNYLAQVMGESVEIPQVDAPPGSGQPSANSAVILPMSIWRLQERRNEAEKWAAIQLLADGEFQAAIDAIQPFLASRGDLPEKLYILGRAQLALADASHDRDMYRDAGLTFMRIVVHFNRDGQPHTLVAPARLEVAYIHRQIGRQDIYERMMGLDGSAGVNLTINDEEAYPQYRLRYLQILGEPTQAQP